MLSNKGNYMATIHVKEIQKILHDRGFKDSMPFSEGGFFLEIKFDDPTYRQSEIDEELKNKVITCDCPYGNVIIKFDDKGQLKSIDLS